MRSSRLVALPTLTLLAGVACSTPPRTEFDPNVVAWVGAEPVSRDAFAAELAREVRTMDGSGVRSPAQVEPYKRALLEGIVNRTLLLKAAQDAGVVVTTDEVDRRLLAVESEYPAGSFDEALAQSLSSRAELLQRTREQLVIERLIEAEVHRRVAVTEEQVRRSFEERAGELRVPERVHAQQILVRSLDEAKRLRQLAISGKPFGELARRYSLAPEAKVGGDLGVFPRGQMPPVFDEALFKLGPGQTSDVVATEYGFHVFRLVERWPASAPSLGEVRAKLEERLLAVLRHERERDFVERLRASARVRVNEEVLASIQVLPPP